MPVTWMFTFPFLAGVGSGFGLCLSLVIALAVVVDLLFVYSGKPTISYRTLVVTTKYPVIAAVITAIVMAPVFMLLGHLLFPQVINATLPMLLALFM